MMTSFHVVPSKDMHSLLASWYSPWSLTWLSKFQLFVWVTSYSYTPIMLLWIHRNYVEHSKVWENSPASHDRKPQMNCLYSSVLNRRNKNLIAQLSTSVYIVCPVVRLRNYIKEKTQCLNCIMLLHVQLRCLLRLNNLTFLDSFRKGW